MSKISTLETLAITCIHCGKPITGKYVKDYWGNVYHAGHLRQALRCFYCGRLISKGLTGGGKTYRDGRIICGLCMKSAIDDPAATGPILEDVRSRLKRYGITVKGNFAETHLLDRGGLAKVSGRRAARSEEAGFTKLEKKTVNGRLASFSMQIFILKGLPETHFIATAAHELMHVWQHLFAVPNNDPALREGSCNYAAYLILRELSGETARKPGRSDEANYIIETFFNIKDRIYGKGFLKVYQLVKNRGITGWLDYLRNKKR